MLTQNIRMKFGQSYLFDGKHGPIVHVPGKKTRAESSSPYQLPLDPVHTLDVRSISGPAVRVLQTQIQCDGHVYNTISVMYMHTT